MRTLSAIALVLLALAAHAEEAFQTAIVLDASAYRENAGGVAVPLGNAAVWGATKENLNMIKLQLGDIAITATYKTVFKNGKNSAGSLIIGQTVQAQVGGRGDRKLIVRIPNGGEIDADIVRREAMSADIPRVAVTPQ